MPERDTITTGDDLARRAALGDRSAFDHLAAAHRGLILAIVYRRVANRAEAEDLVQEVLLTAWEKLPGLKDPHAFPHWLGTIAVNACRMWRRRSVNWPASLDDDPELLEIPDPQPGPLESVLARERERAWRRALDTLPHRNRLALLLHVWGGYSYHEIARLLRIPVTTVEGRTHRARVQLRQRLREERLLVDEFIGGKPHV